MDGTCIFACPKAFDGHVGNIQCNAIHSWSELGDDVEVLLIGDDDGTAEVAERYGVRHVPDVERNEQGTPLISDIFAQAHEHSEAPRLLYANADIVLDETVPQALRKTDDEFASFLLVGRRTDLDVREEGVVEDADRFDDLRERAREDGFLRGWASIDYFGFPRGAYDDVPDFAIGRVGWDNWMVRSARERAMPVVDATEFATVVHQDHGYGHLEGGLDETRFGEEAERNMELAGGRETVFTIADATHEVDEDGQVKAAIHPFNLWRRVRTAGELEPRLQPLTWAAKKVEQATHPVRDSLNVTLTRTGRD
jgi:hypothetical protein